MRQHSHVVYESRGERGFRLMETWRRIFSSIRNYRFLWYELTKATLTAQFKKSLLGVSWLVLTPILTILAWLLLHSSGIFDPGDTRIPYPAYVLISTSIWTFFVSFYKYISEAMMLNGKLFVQIRFPHELVILEQASVAVFNFLIPLLVNIIVLLAFGVQFTWASLLFPFALIPLILFGITIGTIFSLLKVVLVDLNNFFDRVIVLLMYATPVVYATDIDSSLLQQIMYWNPLTYLISMPREILVHGTPYEPMGFLVVSAGVLILFVLTMRYFVVAEGRVVERLTN